MELTELTTAYLEQLVERVRPVCASGKVADYIPCLKNANPNHLGVCVAHADGTMLMAGDCGARFTIQSISKPFSLLRAILDQGMEQVFRFVGMEATGDAFNSIVKLETSARHIPYNAMINAGAITVASMIEGDNWQHRYAHLLDFYRSIAENDSLTLNEAVYLSEKRTGDRNRSIAYLLREIGALSLPVQEALDLYFRQCSVEVSTVDLAQMGLFLARGGVTSHGERLVDEQTVRLVRSQIAICGMYDGSGTFAARVGIPSKSGVGGGILSCVPGRMGIGVFGPALDAHGNSVGGIELLQTISQDFDLSIF